MRKYALAALGLAAVAAIAVVGERYVAKHTTKIDEEVSIITLDEIVIVTKAGALPRVTKIKPAETKPRTVRLPPDPKQPPAAKPAPPATIKWTLPYSCSDVRFYNSHFSRTQLEAMRKAAGMALPTADQKRQIDACLAGKVT